jgi:hypothetical protein
MTDFTSGVLGKPARSRRRSGRVVILVICAALALTVFVCCCALAAMVAVVFNGLGSLFNGLGEFVGAMLWMAIALCSLAVFPLLMELLALLCTGQLIPFAIRLVQLLASP